MSKGQEKAHKGILSLLRTAVDWVARHSLWSLPIIGLPLLFPSGALPFLALGLVILVQLCRWIAWGLPRWRAEDAPLFFMLAMAALGLAISVDRALSWPRWWSLLLGVIIFFELRRSLRLQRQAEWIAAALLLAGLGLAAISLAGTDWKMVRFIDLPWLYDRLPTLIRGLPDSGAQQSSDLFNPRWVGILMGALAPAYLPLLAWRGRPALRALSFFSILVTVLTLLLTQSIQGLLGLMAGIFMILLFISPWLGLLAPLSALLAAWAVWVFGPREVAAYLLSMENPLGQAVVLRLDIWSRAWAMLQDMPFTGVGMNVFSLIQSQFYTGNIIGPAPHAHNLFMQTALDMGLPGLAAFICFLMIWSWQTLRGIRALPASGARLLLIGAMAGVASYLAHGLIDALMLGAKPGFMIWALLGIGAVEFRKNGRFPLFASDTVGDSVQPLSSPNPFSPRKSGREGESPTQPLSTGAASLRPNQARQDTPFRPGKGLGDRFFSAATPVRMTGYDSPDQTFSLRFKGERRLGDERGWLRLLALATAYAALPLAFGLFAVVQPAKVYMNLGALQAQWALYPFPGQENQPAESFASAEGNLQRALLRQGDLLQAHLLLGRMASLSGRQELAWRHYTQFVMMDTERTMETHYPPTAWLRLLRGEAAPAQGVDAIQIYGYWKNRFPQRAEGYVLLAIAKVLYQQDAAGGLAVIAQGEDNRALPRALLDYAHQQLQNQVK